MGSIQRLREALALVLFAAVALTGAGAPGQRERPKPLDTIADPPWLREYLEEQRTQHRVPALAAAVVVDGEVVAASAVGFRRWGGARPRDSAR
jgi:hypothetical protein